jgi:DNA primase
MADWINFQGLRERLDFAEVLRHYNVEMKPAKHQSRQQGFCPLPTHRGQRRSPSFSVDHHRKLWRCFGCNKGGNILDFCVRMEGKDPADNRQVLDVARLLRDRFGLDASKLDAGTTPKGNRLRKRADGVVRETHGGSFPPDAPHVVNAPLDFELKDLDPDHPYLRGRGFTAETVRHFGLGFCKRGAFQGRAVIPLHDSAGRLIGYAGRLVDDSHVSEREPKYKFPSSRLRGDTVLEFRKSLFLYNGHRIEKPVHDLVVVEGFASVWWLWQHGYHHVVSVMGSSCSMEQGKLLADLVEPPGTVWSFTDGDDGGERCAGSILLHVGQHRSVRHVPLAKGEQPTSCTADDLTALFRFDPPDDQAGRASISVRRFGKMAYGNAPENCSVRSKEGGVP